MLATTQLSIRPINVISQSNFINYRYEVQLTNVVEEFNASQFSCSISTGSPERILQWKGTAELIVEPASISVQTLPPIMPPGGNDSNVTVPIVSSTPNNGSNRSAITAASVVLVVIIFALVVAISLLLATFTKWRRKQREQSNELSQGKYSSMNTVGFPF